MHTLVIQRDAHGFQLVGCTRFSIRRMHTLVIQRDAHVSHSDGMHTVFNQTDAHVSHSDGMHTVFNQTDAHVSHLDGCIRFSIRRILTRYAFVVLKSVFLCWLTWPTFVKEPDVCMWRPNFFILLCLMRLLATATWFYFVASYNLRSFSTPNEYVSEIIHELDIRVVRFRLPTSVHVWSDDRYERSVTACACTVKHSARWMSNYLGMPKLHLCNTR
jgi:hypothetical protein